MNKFKKLFTDPLAVCGSVFRRCSLTHKMSDQTYTKWDVFFGIGHFPNLENPQTYTEKIQWLKLNDRHEEYTQLVDKYEAKDYVANIIGSEHIIPTLGVWNHFDEIDFDQLPNQFVLKTTHDSGGVVIVSDKSKFDKKKARKKLEKSLKNRFYFIHREYPYKNVQPRIIAEKFMVDESGTELKDYKFFCFNGEVKMLFIATDRPKDTHIDFYDAQFNHLPFERGYKNSKKEIKKPNGFDKMIALAEKLSTGFPHVRVDLYDINGDIYFGEMTFFPGAGVEPFKPAIWDKKIGDWLELPQK
jgi:hypothetical protein